MRSADFERKTGRRLKDAGALKACYNMCIQKGRPFFFCCISRGLHKERARGCIALLDQTKSRAQCAFYCRRESRPLRTRPLPEGLSFAFHVFFFVFYYLPRIFFVHQTSARRHLHHRRRVRAASRRGDLFAVRRTRGGFLTNSASFQFSRRR